MKLLSFLAALIGPAWAINFYVVSIYAPEHPQFHAKIVNACDRAFVVGADAPSTHCGLRNPEQCPDGVATLVDEDLSILAAAVPGGQGIYVLADGLISYTLAHSAMRPPGSQAGGFYASQVVSDRKASSTIISWRSSTGTAGLWICPLSPIVPVTIFAVLKASTQTFTSQGCLAIAGLRIDPAGSAFGAWEYT